MITGLNHITLSVTDVERSFDFYVRVLGCEPVATWKNGAYLTAGGIWLALVLDEKVRSMHRPDYSHIAFSCSEDKFEALVSTLRAEGCRAWSENRSEGESFYFQDPDGHRLEIHVGDLETRLDAMRAQPWDEIKYFSDP